MQPFVPDANPLVITRVFHARQSLVYQALTDSEVMSRWFLRESQAAVPTPVCEDAAWKRKAQLGVSIGL